MEKYKSLMNAVDSLLKAANYRKKGTSFFYDKDDNIGLINFQKSRDSTATSTLFTINLGVYSKTLKIFDYFDIGSYPTSSDCHWSERIGFIMEKKRDFWWEVNEYTSITNLIAGITSVIINLAIPEIEKHISDESLEKYWTENLQQDPLNIQTYIYLIALLKTHDKPSLQSRIDEAKILFEKKPVSEVAKENFLKLGVVI